ncbi:MAG: hypothetical protein RL418_610, partial [Actinomycetota bacterium]
MTDRGAEGCAEGVCWGGVVGG